MRCGGDEEEGGSRCGGGGCGGGGGGGVVEGCWGCGWVVRAGKEGVRRGVLGVLGSASPSGPMSGTDATSSWRKSNCFSPIIHCFLLIKRV